MFLVKSRSLLVLRNICCFSWGRKKNKKKNGISSSPNWSLHTPSEFRTTSSTHACIRIKPMRAMLGSNNKDQCHLLPTAVLAKYRKMSVLRLLQLCPLFAGEKNSSLLLKWPAIFVHHKTPYVLRKNPTHCSWFTPFFSRFSADFCPEKKNTGHRNLAEPVPASPCVTLRILTSRGPVNSGLRRGEQRKGELLMRVFDMGLSHHNNLS